MEEIREAMEPTNEFINPAPQEPVIEDEIKFGLTKLAIWPSQTLKTFCEEVTDFNDDLVKLVKQLHYVMHYFNSQDNLPDAAGLSAPQIGITKRVFVYQGESGPSCMINPKILQTSEDKNKGPEGCLSFPGIFIQVPRPETILVSFQDVDGVEHELEATGFVARVIQHEIDHLNGKIFLQHLSRLKQDIIERKLKKVMKRLKPMQ